jgi:hypothetical protein
MKAMKYIRIPHPLFGFRCAGCGRCLEEMPAWQIGKDRFYCGIFCREADEAASESDVRKQRPAA